MSTTLNEDPPNPTATQGLEITPTLETITPNDFSNFHNSGVSIKIKTPLAKTTSHAMFGICTNGFVPNPIIAPAMIGKMLANFLPVQPFSNALTTTTVFWEPITHMALFQYFSFRFNRGEANINIRVSSNTAQSGNFQISQFSNCQRYYYSDDEIYSGLRFINVGEETKLTLPDGFALLDLSLNRSLGIKPMNRACFAGEDHWNKWWKVVNLKPRTTEEGLNAFNEITSQFLENWIVFSPLSSFPGETGNEITVSVFYDWKEKLFMTPGAPIVPVDFDSTLSGYICNFTDTFKDRKISTVKDYNSIKWVGLSTETHKQDSGLCSRLTPGSSTRVNLVE